MPQLYMPRLYRSERGGSTRKRSAAHRKTPRGRSVRRFWPAPPFFSGALPKANGRGAITISGHNCICRRRTAEGRGQIAEGVSQKEKGKRERKRSRRDRRLRGYTQNRRAMARAFAVGMLRDVGERCPSCARGSATAGGAAASRAGDGGRALYRLYLGIADGMSIALVWACRYSK